MKTTPFTETHISLGAKMHEFAGYNMPIEYSGIIDEHLTVCQGVGVFDVSHMGEFWVKGPHALDFLQTVTSNNVAALTPGKVQYTCFPNEDGGIVDDLLVYRYEQEKYLLVVNASNIEKDWNWCMSHNTMGAELENASDRMAQLAVQGPKAIEALQKLTPVNLSELPYYTFTHGEFAGEPDVIISNTGYTGAGGFELYFYPEAAIKIWNAVFEAGAEFGIKPIGLGARDTLRLEMGFCLPYHTGRQRRDHDNGREQVPTRRWYRQLLQRRDQRRGGQDHKQTHPHPSRRYRYDNKAQRGNLRGHPHQRDRDREDQPHLERHEQSGCGHDRARQRIDAHPRRECRRPCQHRGHQQRPFHGSYRASALRDTPRQHHPRTGRPGGKYPDTIH